MDELRLVEVETKDQVRGKRGSGCPAASSWQLAGIVPHTGSIRWQQEAIQGHINSVNYRIIEGLTGSCLR